MSAYYLGFDAGTQSVKVTVCDEKMQPVASSSALTTFSYPHPGWVEMDVDEYLRLALQGMRACTDQIRKKGLDPAGIRAIMGDGIICGIAGVDKDGNAITPYINYLDSRTKDDETALRAEPRAIWGRETGNPEPKCMFPALFARWFLKNADQWNGKIAKFSHNAPYILSHLAGLSAKDFCIDWGTMSGWGLGYKVEEKCWSQEQLDILGIPIECMPRIVKPWDIIGHLTPEMAEATGLPAGIPVCAGAGDTMQSMIGSGNLAPGQAVDVAGTCAMFCASTRGILPELSRSGNGLIFNSGTLPDTYFYWGYIRTGGLALRWFKDNVCGHAGDGAYYNKLNQEAASVPAGSNGLLFLPYLTGGTDDLKDASACFLNVTMDTDQASMWHAVLEGIGYDYMEVTDQYRAAGVDLTRITVTEGGSRSKVWNQMKADMLGSDVVVPENPGSALVTDCTAAAYAVGDLPDIAEAVQNNFQIAEEYHWNRETHAFYRSAYEKKQKLVRQDMQQVFAALKELMS